MLTNINIKNFILIDNVNIDFTLGLNIFTGETGAGKSIILDALKFVLGVRISKDIIKDGAEYALVVAQFCIKNNKDVLTILKDNDLYCDDYLLIRRIITADGKSKSYINDIAVGLNIIKSLGGFLVEIHSQHDQRLLTDLETQRNIIDQYGNLTEYCSIVKQAYLKWQEKEKQLVEMQNKRSSIDKEMDYLIYTISELEKLGKTRGEEENLSNIRLDLNKKAKYVSLCKASLNEVINNNIMQHLRSVGKILSKLPPNFLGQEKKLEQITLSLDRTYIEIDEIISLLESILSSVESDNTNIDKIEERLFLIKDIARKYHCHPDDLDDLLISKKNEYQFLKSSIENNDLLEKQINLLKNEFIVLSEDLSKRRKEISTKLEQKLEYEFKYLKLENVKFHIDFKEVENYSSNGSDKIEFLATTNPGQPLASLGKIASGGELSRLILALKVILSNNKTSTIMIFDEVDTGVGGAVADAIGNRLKMLSKISQIIAITHHPQIAAKSDTHFCVKKTQYSDSTIISLSLLCADQKLEEVARMISGEVITIEAKAAAEKLFTYS